MRITGSDPVTIEILSKHLTVVTCLIFTVFAVLFLRLWFLQVVHGPEYRIKSEKNRIHLKDIPPFRGLIFDRNGELLVDNRPSYNVFITPEEVEDLDQMVIFLERMLNLDREVINKKIEEAVKKFPFRSVLIKKNIPRDELAVVETNLFNLPGVMISVNPQRYYLFEKLASHIIGYMGEISEAELDKGRFPANKRGEFIGKYGVEGKWQEALNGLRGGEQVEVDAAGRRLKVLSRANPLPGRNIVLTIDKKLQQLAEDCLKDKKGAIVALEPNTGEILALASSPAFDPNLFIGGIEDQEWQKIVLGADFPLQNRAVAGVYAPGSTFKIVLALAALQEGLQDPQEEIVCDGVYRLGSHPFRCWSSGHGRVNLQRAIVESCDVYFYRLGRRLGADLIAQYARMCGLGAKTGFELGFEQDGLIPSNEWKLRARSQSWQPGDTINMAIGQGYVLVTPIQQANLIAAVFNGGILYQPKIIKQAGSGEDLYRFVPTEKGRLNIKPEHLQFVRDALTKVVSDPHGTGGRARMERILVAGKTGTSQVVALEKNKDKGKAVPQHLIDHAWFIATAPADKPSIALAVLIENGGHGSSSAPLAKRLFEAYLLKEQPNKKRVDQPPAAVKATAPGE